MKYKSLNLASRFPVFSGLVLGILLAGCSAGDAVLPDADPDPEPGEPVILTFDMYSAAVTHLHALFKGGAEKQKEKATVVKTVACVGAIYLSGPSPAKYWRQK